jgi:hypothetical protein
MKRLIIKPACAGATRREAAVSVMAGRLISMAKDGRALRKLISRVKAMEAGGIRTKSVILWLAALCVGVALKARKLRLASSVRAPSGSFLADDACSDSVDWGRVAIEARWFAFKRARAHFFSWPQLCLAANHLDPKDARPG